MRLRPIRPAQGRLLRLGLVLDARNRADRVREIARMAERAGLDALWARESDDGLGGPDPDAWARLAMAGGETSMVGLGAMVNVTGATPERLAAMARSLGDVGARLEIGLGGARAARAAAACALRLLELGVDARLSIEAGDAEGMEAAARAADGVLIRAGATGDLVAAIRLARQACAAVGRDPDTLGVAVELAVSIGRTATEAAARARADEGFARAAASGVVGTLEECQDRMVDLAHAGATEVRCTVPNSADVHDVIAQLSAVAVGRIGALIPNAPRSAAPPPPGWGGRSRRAD